jgi:hypothetical protein
LRGNLSIYTKHEESENAFVLNYTYVIEENESGITNQVSEKEQSLLSQRHQGNMVIEVGNIREAKVVLPPKVV